MGSFAGRHDDASIWNCQPKYCYNSAKIKISNSKWRMRCNFGTGGRFEPRNTDGVRTNAKSSFKFPDVLHQGKQFKTVVEKSEKNANTYIVDACFHSPVKRRNPVVVIRFFSVQVNIMVRFVMVSLLKKLKSTDFGIL